MRALVLHVPAHTGARPCSRLVNIATQWKREHCLEAARALSITTPCQHSVDPFVDSQSDLYRESNVPPWPSQQQQDINSTIVKLNSTASGADVSIGTSNSQDCSYLGLDGASSISQRAANHLADVDQQLTGLHILQRYVATPDELLMRRKRPAVGQVHPPNSPADDDAWQHDHSSYQERQKMIVRQVRRCSSVEQLSEVLDQYGSDMDFISVTSCCTAAARLFRQQQSQQPTSMVSATDLKHIQLHEEAHTPSVVSDKASSPVQDTHSSQTVSHSLQDQIHRLLQQQLVPLLVHRMRRDADADGVVLVLYSLAVVGYRQDQGLLVDLEHMAIQIVPQLRPRLLSQLLWSQCTLGIQPQQQMQMQLLIHSSRKMHMANDQDCAQLIQGFARLKKQPPEQWMYLFYMRASQLLQANQLLPQSLCLIMYSLGRLRLQPPTALLLDFISTSQQVLPNLPPAGIVMLGSALHLLHVKQPSRSWQHSYLQAAHAVLPQCTARELAVLAVPLLRWHCVPQHGFIAQYLEQCEASMSQMTAQGLAVLGYSLSGLRVLPPKHWLLKYFAAAQQQQVGSTPAGCSYFMHTLGAWTCLEAAAGGCKANEQTTGTAGGAKAQRLSPQASSEQADGALSIISLGVVRRLIAQCVECFVQDEGLRFTAEQVGMLCKGMAMAGVRGRQQLSRRLQEVVHGMLGPSSSKQQQQQQPTAMTLVNILLALAVCSPHAATPTVMQCIWTGFSKVLARLTPAQVAAVAWSAAELQHAACAEGTLVRHAALQPPKHLADGLMQQVLVDVDQVALKDLQTLLLSSRQAGWVFQPEHVHSLVSELLKKQRLLLLKQQQRPQQTLSQQSGQTVGSQQAVGTVALGATAHTKVPSQLPCVLRTHSADHACQLQEAHSKCSCNTVSLQDCGGFSTAGHSEACSSYAVGSSSASRYSNRSNAGQLFGSANDRLKEHLGAVAAVAAWADVLTPMLRKGALAACEDLVLRLRHECVSDSALPSAALGSCVGSHRTIGSDHISKEVALTVAKHVYSLASGCSSFSSQGAAADGHHAQRRQKEQ